MLIAMVFSPLVSAPPSHAVCTSTCSCHELQLANNVNIKSDFSDSWYFWTYKYIYPDISCDLTPGQLNWEFSLKHHKSFHWFNQWPLCKGMKQKVPVTSFTMGIRIIETERVKWCPCLGRADFSVAACELQTLFRFHDSDWKGLYSAILSLFINRNITTI